MKALVRIVQTVGNDSKFVVLDYELLGVELAKTGHSLSELLHHNIEPLRYQRVPKPHEVADAPPNVLPILLPILSWEAQALVHKFPFNPRIHVEEGKLVVRYREPYAEMAPTLLLDASAEPTVIRRAFHIDEDAELAISPSLPDLPASVEVYQHSEVDYGKSTVGLFLGDSGLASREAHYQDILKELAGYPYNSQIGVVTFNEIEQELAGYLRENGYKNVVSAHYRNVRSVNDLEKVEALVLYGSTRPSRDHIEVGAKALFFDEKP